MPSSDYTNAVGGGLKLKGGVDKKKHKKKKSKPAESEESKAADTPADSESAVQKALADEEKDEDQEPEVSRTERAAEVKDLGKTEAQRRHEERRRKRVCVQLTFISSSTTLLARY